MEVIVNNNKTKDEVKKISNEFVKIPIEFTKNVDDLTKNPGFPKIPDPNQGYSIEPHRVVTEDGYILTLYRITRDKISSEKPELIESDKNLPSNDGIPRKRSVLLQHGVLCSGDSWMYNGGPDKILPYILVEEGFDCWIGNFRGTPPSRHHVSLKSGSKKYWDFSFHEMGLYDIPAMIDYILKVSGNKDLLYIGHSMGCSTFCLGMAQRPEYCKKVEMMVALGPAVFVSNSTNWFMRYFAMPFQRIIERCRFVYRRETSELCLMDVVQKICPPNKNPDKLARWILRKSIPRTGVVENSQIEESRYVDIAKGFPVPTSMKVMSHITQYHFSGKFRHFNYGRAKNLKKYGQSTPPVYDLNNVDVPVVSFSSEKDTFCVPEDVLKMERHLPNVIRSYMIGGTDPPIGHGDFLIGKDAATVVYDKIVKIFKKSAENSCY